MKNNNIDKLSECHKIHKPIINFIECYVSNLKESKKYYGQYKLDLAGEL